MSKKFNVEDIVNQRKNELGYSPLFQPKSTSTTEKVVNPTPSSQQIKPISQQDARKPESQDAGIPAKHSSIPENQHASNLEIQHNVTATEKVTYRFHPESKYAIEDIKTISPPAILLKSHTDSRHSTYAPQLLLLRI